MNDEVIEEKRLEHDEELLHEHQAKHGSDTSYDSSADFADDTERPTATTFPNLRSEQQVERSKAHVHLPGLDEPTSQQIQKTNSPAASAPSSPATSGKTLEGGMKGNRTHSHGSDVNLGFSDGLDSS